METVKIFICKGKQLNNKNKTNTNFDLIIHEFVFTELCTNVRDGNTWKWWKYWKVSYLKLFKTY